MEEEIKFLLLRQIHRMKKMQYLRSGQVLAVMKPASLQVTCTGCIRNTLNQWGGRLRSPVLRKGPWEDIKKLLLMLKVKEFMGY